MAYHQARQEKLLSKGDRTDGQRRRRADKIYSFSNNLLIWTMRIVDATLRLLFRFRSNADLTSSPRRLLIANGAALGDVLIATSILPHLRRALPGIEIGFLVGSWAKSIVTNHPYIDRLHFIDSPLMNRQKVSVLAKIWGGLTSAYTGLRELRDVQYDAVVDLHFNLGNYASILWLSGIPRRIGYVSGGFGPLLTETHAWKRELPIAMANAQLFHCVGIETFSAGLLKPVLPSVSLGTCEKVDRLFQDHDLVAGTYVVVHLGTGAPFREWPSSNWNELISWLTSRSIRVVCTGSGAREQELINESCADLKNVVKLCGAISFSEYLEVVRRSALLIGVESLSGHVAAAASVPSVQIYSGIFALETWRPLNARCKVVTHFTECAPCGRRGGCATMACVRGVTSTQVLLAAEEFLPTGNLSEGASSKRNFVAIND
jgi:ADP-heptose:LPS heptosyltransferase